MPASIQPGETGNHGNHELSSLVVTPQLEEALGLLYRGQTNVAKKAKELDIPLALLQTLLNKHITQIPRRRYLERRHRARLAYIT